MKPRYGETFSPFQRMHVTTLQVFNDGDFKALRIGQFPNVHRHGFDSRQLRRTVAPPSGYHLVGLRVDGSHQ